METTTAPAPRYKAIAKPTAFNSEVHVRGCVLCGRAEGSKRVVVGTCDMDEQGVHLLGTLSAWDLR